jgi:signal transduction histidine kinase
MVVFMLKYGNNATDIPLIVNIDENTNRILFYSNFFSLFVISVSCLYGFLFSSGFFARSVCLVFGIITMALSVYILDEIFIVKTCMYTAFLIAFSFVFEPPKSFISAAGILLLFLLCAYHPSFLGNSPVGMQFVNPPLISILTAMACMSLVSACIIFIRFLMDKYIYNADTIQHLNVTGKKMVLFNHQLQQFAKRHSEESVLRERLRFTRELHDSSGYAFTNIIMVTDAAVSRGKIETADAQEIFNRIRSLAANGLQETRETLHLIRRIQEPYTKSIETVHQLKTIFEEVSGIVVDVEYGNMKYEYSPAVNKVLAQIIQEAFTNSIRHGKATHIIIQFWEQNNELTMSVTDNGIGTTVIVKGIGLAGMEERLDSIGGKLEASSPSEGGFRLKITVPLNTRQDAQVENTAEN